jgi:hypothetical protein
MNQKKIGTKISVKWGMTNQEEKKKEKRRELVVKTHR